MNDVRGHNAFNDIPGFDASKGERIARALQKLWGKVESLEQARITKRNSRSKETVSKNDDITFTDVQYKLLFIQLQYVRSILRQRRIKDSENQVVTQEIQTRNNVTQEIQTRNNYAEEKNVCINSEILEDPVKRNDQDSTDLLPHKSKEHNEHLASSKTSSKPHYHLKLNDVPFILGASSSASHSVVANLQNIIGMMKFHHKAVCGSKHQASRSVKTVNPAAGDIQDTTKMMKNLREELHELSLKQKKLKKSIEAAEGNVSKNYHTASVRRLCDAVKHIPDPNMKRVRSNSESEIKLHAEVNFPKRKENDFLKYDVQQRQNALNVRKQPSNLSIMDRRKLLRSLQNFKTLLSEEDISWD